MKFKELNLSDKVVNALTDIGLDEATEIQEKTIPKIKEGIDVIAISKTGSGKTLAFSAPLIDLIVPGKGIQALVIVPVRELAEQVHKEIEKFSKYIKPKVTLIYGGVGIEPQIHHLRTADIVVGTPGRILDHLNRRSMNLTQVKLLVLDEADKMVSMGFIEDVEEIIRYIPKQSQILLFGATISHEIAHLRDKYMKSPVTLKAISHVDDKLLEQFYYDIPGKEKFSLLVHLINKEKPKLAIVFCSTRRNADVIAGNLVKNNVDAQVIHGGMSQNKRTNTIEGFHRGKPHILVATTVAARGLHINNVTHIFIYDVPKNSEEYVHQIGRTARAGETGKAITLLSENDHALFSAIVKRYPVKITKLPREEFAKLIFVVGRRDDGDRGGNRFSRNSRGGRPQQRRRY